jgi:hypothetical protein
MATLALTEVIYFFGVILAIAIGFLLQWDNKKKWNIIVGNILLGLLVWLVLFSIL